LGNLCNGHSENATAAVAAGAQPPLLACLRADCSDRLRGVATGAVNRLLFERASCNAAAVAGAVPLLLDSLQHSHHTVRLWAVDALSGMTDLSPECRNAVVAHGGIQRLIYCLCDGGSDCTTREAAASALANLAVHKPAVIPTVVSAGTVSAALQLFSRHCCTGVKGQLLRLLGYLAGSDPRCRSAIAASDILPLLVVGLAGGGSAVMQTGAAHVINTMVALEPGCRPAMLAAGAASVLQSLLQSSDNDWLRRVAAVTLNDLGVASQQQQQRDQQWQQQQVPASRGAGRAGGGVASRVPAPAAGDHPAPQPASAPAAATTDVCAAPGCSAVQGLRRCSG
jgi:hypothetical protein